MDYKFKHGDKVRVVRLNSQCTGVVRLNSQCTARNSSRIKVGDVFTIEGPFDHSFAGSNERIYSVQEKTLIFWEDELELVDGVQDNKEAANVEMVHLDFMIPKNNKEKAIRIAKDAVKKVYFWTQEDINLAKTTVLKWVNEAVANGGSVVWEHNTFCKTERVRTITCFYYDSMNVTRYEKRSFDFGEDDCYSEWIGKCITLAKVLNKLIPDFIKQKTRVE